MDKERDKYCVSFSSVGYDKGTTKVYIDEIDQGRLPLMMEMSEGCHKCVVKLLINFRWKEKCFDIDVHQNTLVVVKFNRIWGSVKIIINGASIA